MVTIPLGVGDWESASENVSRLRLRNMYLTENPQSPDGVSRVSRPTLSLFSAVGPGPINAIWRQDATLGGDFLIVSGTVLYRMNETTRDTSVVGSLPGSGLCKFAGTEDRVVIVRSGVAYSTDGTTLTTIVMPDDVPPYDGIPAPVSSVACINSFFLLTVQGTQRFYWIQPGETNPDPLDFASAERVPDAIIDVAILMDEIWFIGSAGPEVWQTSPDPEVPFQRINGRVYSEGCASKDTVAQGVFNNLPCLLWVTDTRSVVLAQGAVQKVSTEAVEEKLKTATNLRAWTFRNNRHDFYALTSNTFTYVFDLLNRTWSRWDSFNLANFLAHVGTMSGPRVYAGSYSDNKVFLLGEGLADLNDPVIREASGLVLNPGKAVKCSSVCVRVNAGWSPSLGLTPKLEMRWSDDQGATWSDYVAISLGDQGQYYTDTIFRSLGLINRPGRNFEFRFTERARFRIDYAVMNEE